jgi:ligand-binding sensor protein/AraC-like DNA-binding protein
MDNYLLDLKHIIDLAKFQVIQDEISELTRLAIITVDYRGIPITKHSSRSNFCSLVRNNADTYKKCVKCDSRGGLEAARIKAPFIYRCHCGVVDFAIPIIVQDKYLGAVMAGEVLTDDLDKLEYIVDNADLSNTNIDSGELYRELPVMPLQQIKKLASTIFNICNYIVEESIIKNSLYEINQKMMQYFEIETLFLADGSVRKIYSMFNRNIEEVHDFLNKIANNGINTSENIASGNFVAHKLLRPALDYIDNNLSSKFNVRTLATICHVSESYFSKLFNREIGYSFPEHINMRKIEKAKNWLSSTNKSISEIAADLGFNDSGYFIKTFKHKVGITPLAFKKLNINSDGSK